MICLAGVSLLLSGCLLPSPIEEGQPFENSYPVILPNQLSPNPTVRPVKILYVDCPEYRFRASVIDPDAEDEIFWRFFINYDQDNDPFAENVSSIPPVENDPSAQVIGFAVATDDTRFSFRRPTPEQLFQEPHTVELLVSDRPFSPPEDERDPLGRAVQKDGLTAHFIWTIQLSDDPKTPEECTGGSG